MTDWVNGAFQVLKRLQYVRQTCGSLPENVANLELKLQCMIQVQKQHQINHHKSPGRDEAGIWKVLDNFIHQMIEALDEMVDFLNRSQESSKEQLLEYAKTFVGIGGSCEGFSSLVQRLSDQLQVVLFSVQAIHQGDISHEMETTNELLRAILEIQMKKHDEIDRHVATVKQQKKGVTFNPVPEMKESKDAFDDEDQLQQSLKSLMVAHEAAAGGFTTVRKKKKDSAAGAAATAHSRRASIAKENLFEDPIELEKQAEEAAELGRKTLKRPHVEFDSEDTERLRQTLKLDRGVSLGTIQAELEKRGIDIAIIPKAQCGFMEIKHKHSGVKKFFKKGAFKVRWIVHNPGTSYISLYRSPYDVDCVPEKGRIFLRESTVRPLKQQKKGRAGKFASFESSLGFTVEQYDGQKYSFRTNDEGAEIEWKNVVESVLHKSVPTI
eukprot:TRINITY_DN1606_c0_g1_i1.p1 TRINITY_DN1606_c0_g1~~TRINITY_DN1606_c0_g1_i1.p1  ORF type:complete len:438 (+),score=118.20 TRINITY_DN1606_c0_g1_i1:54-1367(+)